MASEACVPAVFVAVGPHLLTRIHFTAEMTVSPFAASIFELLEYWPGSFQSSYSFRGQTKILQLFMPFHLVCLVLGGFRTK
jgi:hypothetical protein